MKHARHEPLAVGAHHSPPPTRRELAASRGDVPERRRSAVASQIARAAVDESARRQGAAGEHLTPRTRVTRSVRSPVGRFTRSLAAKSQGNLNRNAG
jgi:hypothetical protein